jgi:cytochrome c-type biogenesis protein CcmH
MQAGDSMAQWLVFALMTAAAIFVVLWPLGRSRVASAAGSDVLVYEDQLREVARDRAAGLIGASEAEAARIEVSRRLLAAADRPADPVGLEPAPPWRRRTAALIAIIGLPVGAIGLYSILGSPHLPDQPLAARMNAPAENPSIETLVAQVESRLAGNPDDARGWQVIAPVYMRLGRFADAVNARRNVMRLLGESADREADLGEALVAVAEGTVTGEARAAFERTHALDPQHPKARFYIGLAAEQDGKPQQAADIWRALLAGAPPDAPWTDLVRQSLARLERAAVAVGTARGPSQSDVAAAAALAPEQRGEMIRGMVERLAERLRRDGSDLEGWLQLIRAYAVLGERDKARGAAASARRSLATDPDKLRHFDELVKGLGLEG